jgi:hypothetical protein
MDNVKVPMVKTPIIREPFSKIAIDIVGRLSRTKKQPFLTTLVKQSDSPFNNHLLTPIFSSKHCSHNKMQIGCARVST